MKKTTDWLKIILLFLPETIIVAVVLVIIWYFEIRVPLWAMVTGIVLFGIIAYLTTRAIMYSFNLKQTTGREAMIGMRAEVIETLRPEGLIRVEGELWRARANGEEEIPAGEIVEILNVEALVLEASRRRPG